MLYKSAKKSDRDSGIHHLRQKLSCSRSLECPGAMVSEYWCITSEEAQSTKHSLERNVLQLSKYVNNSTDEFQQQFKIFSSFFTGTLGWFVTASQKRIKKLLIQQYKPAEVKNQGAIFNDMVSPCMYYLEITCSGFLICYVQSIFNAPFKKCTVSGLFQVLIHPVKYYLMTSLKAYIDSFPNPF